MARKHYTADQIITHPPQAEVEFVNAQTTAEVCRKLGLLISSLPGTSPA